MPAFERRLAIISVLRLRRCDTRGNLAAEFGVSKRTIENDVTVLSLKYPIYTKQGKGGGIFLTDDYIIGVPRLNGKQTDLLAMLLETLEGENRRTMEEIIERYGSRPRAIRGAWQSIGRIVDGWFVSDIE